MKSSAFDRRHSVALVAVLVMVGSIFYSGLLKPVGARDIDARYFYVAARCWASGESPYDAARYTTMYRATFKADPEAPFVAYLPTLMPAILPMAPLEWRSAARVFAILNFSAAMVLLWATYKLMRQFVGHSLRPVHWAWLILGITIGGTAATISTGQTSLLISAACALALLGCRLNNRAMIVVGIVIASAKPHLSAPIFLFILIFEFKHIKSVVIAGGIILAFIIYAAVLDGNFLVNYLGSIQTYSSLSNNDPKLQIGLGSLLANTRLSTFFSRTLEVIVFVATLAAAGMLYRKARLAERGRALAISLAFFTIGILHPIQGYDLCIYALGLALLSVQPVRMQLVLLAPALLLWRPGIVSKLVPTLTMSSIANVAWILLLAGCLFETGRLLSARSIATELTEVDYHGRS